MIFVTVPEWLENCDFRAMVNAIASMLAELDGTLFVSFDNEDNSLIIHTNIDNGMIAVVYVKGINALMYKLKLDYFENKETIEDAYLWVYDWLIRRANAMHLKSATDIL